MKSCVQWALFALVLCLVLCVSCNHNPNADVTVPDDPIEEPVVTHTVTFHVYSTCQPGLGINTWPETGTEYEVKVPHGERVERPYPDPVRPEFTMFNGWFQENNREVTNRGFDFDAPITEDVHVYALYTSGTPTYYTLTFVNEGEEYSAQTVRYGCVPQKVETPTRTGYVFVEWNESADGSGDAFDFLARVLKNTVVYAVWDAV